MKRTFGVLMITLAFHSSIYAVDDPAMYSNEIPMYGGKHTPNLGTNVELSEAVAKLGWKYYNSGDFSTAMKRFNQAWALNKENPSAYWGFGLLMGRKSLTENPEYNLRESIKYLKIAQSYSPKNALILVNLAYSYTLLGKFLLYQNKSAKDEFNQARELYKKAEKLAPEHFMIYSNWSILEFYSGDYSAAKKLLDKAKSLGFKGNPAYEKDLDSHKGLSNAGEVQAKLKNFDIITTYYTDRRPERLVGLIDTLPDSLPWKAYPSIAGFFAVVFQTNPEWIDRLFPSHLNPKTAATMHTSLHLAGDLSISPDLESKLRAAGKDPTLKSVFTDLPEHLENLHITSPSHLDILWGASFASGDPHFVQMIIDFFAQTADRSEDIALGISKVVVAMAGGPDDTLKTLKSKYGAPLATEIIFAASALWSLESNAKQHPFVKQALEKYVKDHPDTFATKAIQATVISLKSPVLSISHKIPPELLEILRAIKASSLGPVKISLIDQATLMVPKNYFFIPKEFSFPLYGLTNQQPGLLGFILPNNFKNEATDAIIIVKFNKVTNIKRYETKNFNPDGLLEFLQNDISRQVPSLKITGWIEPPHHDDSRHTFIYSLLIKSTVANQSTEREFYYMDALGQEGCFSFIFQTAIASTQMQNKVIANEILSSLQFNEDKKYDKLKVFWFNIKNFLGVENP